MSKPPEKIPCGPGDAQPFEDAAPERPDCAGTGPDSKARPVEIGGRKGPEPTRYGDWEKNGRCIDF